MKIGTFLAVAGIIAVWSGMANARMTKQNIVVQSYKDVMKNNMFEPGFNPAGYDARKGTETKPNDTDSVIAVSDPNEKPKDYNKEMAEGLFAEPDMSPLNVEVLEKQNNAKVNIGQPLQIILPESGTAKWLYESKFKHIEILEDYVFQGQRVLNAAVKNKGKEKIYFDLIDDSNGSVNVLESRILNITAN